MGENEPTDGVVGAIRFSASAPRFCLTHDADDIPTGETIYKTRPPIRHDTHRQALWDALRDGLIQMISSSHTGRTPPRDGDFIRSPAGAPSIQTLLPAIWTEANRRGFEVARLADWLALYPAHSLGLAGIEGEICPGADADLVVWEPETPVLVELAMLFGHE